MLLRLITPVLCAAALWGQEVSQSGLELQRARPMVSQPERAPHAMVASTHELATAAGLEILKKGGNAVDAAVAVGFVLAVVHPEAGNIGGGGYMLVRTSDGRAKVIDYRETAPASAHPKMFAEPREARVGYKASAVPGTVAGMEMAHKLFGRLSWKQVLEPARKLAKEGFPASQRMELILSLQVPVMKQYPETARLFLRGGAAPLKQGDILRQPELAATIVRIQKHGARDFYRGETARLIAADMARNKGTITLEDLAGYKAIARDPLEGTYRGHRILTVPPSSGGGVALIEMLNILERFPMQIGMEGSATSRHLMIEAMKRAYRDRSEHAADPAFHAVPVEKLVGKEYAAELAQAIRIDRATPQKELPAGVSEEESEDTTHYSIIDAGGNIASNTYTLNGFYGSQVIPKGTGVLLNDIMSAFSTRDSSKNVVAAGKRPVSSMSPVIILHGDNTPMAALGSPGALTISNTVMQVIVNLIDFRMSLRDAIEYPRIHHQFSPDRVDAEPGALVADVAERLKAFGQVLNPKYRSQGDVHAVMVEEKTGWRLGWSDGRRGGKAMGY
jgi:gamma-glutamyltranspeptidase/glutathione hydrolase